MGAKQAIVTLVVGDRYKSEWRRFSQPGWLAYAKRHHLDLIPLEERLDTSHRSAGRSPSWQKLLILSQDFARRYERIIWVDSDVVINPDAPLITDGVPPQRVGAVDEYSFPSRGYHSLAIRRVAEALSLPEEHVWPTPESYYETWGLLPSFQEVVQAGVLVLSPEHHREICEHTYYAYEDRGGPIWHYEMPPLSYELLSNDFIHWIDQRFNTLWMYIKALHYPWLLEKRYGLLRSVKGARRLSFKLEERRLRRPLMATFLNSYFLHFAGCPRDVRGLEAPSYLRPQPPLPGS